MVAKIKSGKSLIGALNYNENKVKEEKATPILASGFLKDLGDLTFYDKLLRLNDLAARNERTRTNTVHISLNFANNDSLNDQQMQEIANDYMKGIGFEQQPYLVYRHHDAGHPHLHIVTTNIKADGERISLHYLGQNSSERARKEIEIKYGLVKAEEQAKLRPAFKAEPSITQYGSSETKRAITNVLGFILRAYKYTSIPELNAVLAQYKIAADCGSKGSRMYSKKGLVYWMLDKHGEKTGVPIKASTIYGRPTMKTLEANFRLNETLRKPFKAPLITAITEVLGKSQTQKSFNRALWEKNIHVLLRQNNEGRIYGVTFIDLKNKAVFNGSDLGKEFSANSLVARLIPEPKITQPGSHLHEQPMPLESSGNELLDALIRAEWEDPTTTSKFRKRKKRKGLKL